MPSGYQKTQGKESHKIIGSDLKNINPFISGGGNSGYVAAVLDLLNMATQ